MSEFDPSADGATINLNADDALILSDLLSRWFDGKILGKPTIPRDCFEHPAEYWALNEVFGQLESQLVAPFTREYGELVDAARERLSTKFGDLPDDV